MLPRRMDTEQRTNWAGNLRYAASRLHRPESIEELQAIVARSRRVKVVGSRHSFSDIADTTGEHVSLEKLNRILALDPDARLVQVQGGITYGELARHLDRHGFALHNLASLPHITVAGAIATATHGSGDALGNLATAVVAIELVTDDGSRVTFSRREHPAEFAGVVVNLGALGVVASLTLAVEPSYQVAQYVMEELPAADVEEHFAAVMGSAYSVSLFTDWRAERYHQLWSKLRLDPAPTRARREPTTAEIVGAHPSADADRDAPVVPLTVNRVFPPPFPTATGRGIDDARPALQHVHPLPGQPVINCTPQLGVPGPWHERLPHFRLEYTPSSGLELQSEYFVRREHAAPALRELFRMRAAIARVVQVSEVRTIAADDLWLSPCYRQACAAIHFTWRADGPGVLKLLPRIEAALEPFEARPHWGKLFTISPERLHALYPRLPNFQQLRSRLDPTGKFRNRFLDATIGAP